MAKVERDGLVVARRPGTRMFLAGTYGFAPSFEGPNERTIFFRPEQAESDLRRMRIPFESVELRPAKFSLHLE